MIPTNLSDAISAVRDGEFGLPEDIKIGDLVVSALTGLSAAKYLNVTRKPVEAGYSMTDAAIDEPQELVLTICLANPDYSVEAGLTASVSGSVAGFTETWRDKKKQLYQMMTDRELVTVITHDEPYENMIVASIDPYYDVDDNLDAFIASVLMLEIQQIPSGVGGLRDQAEQSVGEQ